MKNFWTKLDKPFFCLAPMEEVTDVAFREMFARYSNQKLVVGNQQKIAQNPQLTTNNSQLATNNPFVMFTEFVNVDGLTHPEGRKKLAIDLKYTQIQRPIVAQLWGTNPEKFYQAAQIVAELGFDGIDINMGCPQSKEIQIGACAALIREPKLAQEIIFATKEGWLNYHKIKIPTTPSATQSPLLEKEGSTAATASPPAKQGEVVGVPVSVKTRIGYSKPEEMEAWIKNLLETDIAALTIHGRTKQEMSKVPAHWDKIAEAVAIRNKNRELRSKKQNTLIIGNGDIKSYEDGLEKVSQTGVDGIMVGRGAFGDPWFFREDGYRPGQKERLLVMLEHAELFEKTFSGIKSFYLMRKHFKAYCSGFLGAHELRAKLMEVKSFEETKTIVQEYLKTAPV